MASRLLMVQSLPTWMFVCVLATLLHNYFHITSLHKPWMAAFISQKLKQKTMFYDPSTLIDKTYCWTFFIIRRTIYLDYLVLSISKIHYQKQDSALLDGNIKKCFRNQFLACHPETCHPETK